jgi:hypothetical protein
VTFQMPLTVNRIITSGKGTASKRPARMHTSIPRKFDLKGSGLEPSGGEQDDAVGYYRMGRMEMLNMEGSIGVIC